MVKKIDASTMELEEKLVALNRVCKTVKGGRIQRFTAIMVARRQKRIMSDMVWAKRLRFRMLLRKGIEDARKILSKYLLRVRQYLMKLLVYSEQERFCLSRLRKVPVLLQAEQSVTFWRWPELKTSAQSVSVQTIRQMLLKQLLRD